MSSDNAPSLALTPHPFTRCDAVRSLSVRMQRRDAGSLFLNYVLEGDLSRIRIPVAREPSRTDELWKHTCFEAFVTAALPGYLELNFSPSGAWAAYRFQAYRAGVSAAQVSDFPRIRVQRGPQLLQLEATVSVAGLADPTRQEDPDPGAVAAGRGARLALTARAALAAVIELDDGTLTYWAHRHPPGRPDFHHPAGFTLELS